RQRVVRFLVEGELVRGTRLVPARVVVVARGPVQSEDHVVVRSHPFAGVDDAPLKRCIDVGGWDEGDRAARLGTYLPTKGADAVPEAFVVGYRVDRLPDPTGHLRRLGGARARDEIECAVRLFHQPKPVALVEPGRHALGVHAERNGMEPLDRRLPGAVGYP